MNRAFLLFFSLVLVFSLSFCSKTNTKSNADALHRDGSVPGEPVASQEDGTTVRLQHDWQKICLGELLAAQKYAEAKDRANYDPKGKYPINMYKAQLIDLNFDGVPEIFLFEDRGGGEDGVRLLTITGNGAQLIFQDWSIARDFILLRKQSDKSLAFGFKIVSGMFYDSEGAYYLTDANTKMDAGIAKAAKVADYSESLYLYYDYEGYDELEYSPNILIWGWDMESDSIIPHPESEIQAFVNSYRYPVE